MIVNLNSKVLLEKYLLLLYFEEVNVTLATQWKQCSRELNFVSVKMVLKHFAREIFSREIFSIFLEIPVEDSLPRLMN